MSALLIPLFLQLQSTFKLTDLGFKLHLASLCSLTNNAVKVAKVGCLSGAGTGIGWKQDGREHVIFGEGCPVIHGGVALGVLAGVDA